MSVKISTLASAQITNHSIDKYVLCKMYNANNVFQMNLSILNASWNESREFGVKVLNISVNNSGGVHNKGATFEIKNDYKIVLIEGYDTGVANDKYPKFKGYVQDVKISIDAGVSVINVTIYDEFTLTKRSDIDKLYVSETTKVSDETFTPIIDNQLGSIKGNPVGERTRIRYVKGNTALSGMLDANYFFVGSNMLYSKRVTITPDGNLLNMIFYSGAITGTLLAGDILVNADGSYRAVVGSTPLSTWSGENTVSIEASAIGNFGDGETLYVVGAASTKNFVAKAFFQVNAVKYNTQTITAAGLGIVNNDIVHNGMINGYKSAHANWASFKVNKVSVIETGLIGEDDLYEGYEVNDDKGIIRLNEAVRIDKYTVKGTYYYYPKGLYVEDVLKDLLVEPDGLVVNSIINPYFKQGTTSWNKSYGNGADAGDIVLTPGNGMGIKCINSLLTTEFIGISQTSITIYSGYTYSIGADIQQIYGTSGNITLTLNSSTGLLHTIATGDAIDYTTNTRLSGTYTPTVSQTNISFTIKLSGVEESDLWTINDVKIANNPAKVNTFTNSNVYCNVSIENGSASAYSMVTNIKYTALPRYANLTQPVTTESTNIQVNSTVGFDYSGIIQIGNEYVYYDSKTATQLNTITRGYQSTTQANHDIGIRTHCIVSASRIWYMEYNNIIPKVSNSTASTYDSVNGVNVGSAGSFTVTGGTFNEFFYREGLVVTSGVVTEVKMKKNYDYYFCQLQSTGVETSYVLLDYRQQKTKYDAIKEIRSMLAPNYIVSTVVRKSGSDYVSFIKGRYLTQRATDEQDYNLDFINKISYTEPTDTYNRVKLFGKLANPVNLMYNPGVAIIPVNDLQTEYLKGVEYNYVETNGPWYVYRLFGEKRFANVDNQLNHAIRRNCVYYQRGNIMNGYNVSNGAQGIEYYLTRINEFHVYEGGWQRHYNLSAGIKIYTVYAQINEYRGWAWGYKIKIYNTYYVTYNAGGRYAKGDRINGTSTVERVVILDSNAPYDDIIYVEHDKGTAIFNSGNTLTNGTITSTGYGVDIDGTATAINYNTDAQTNISVANIYRPVNRGINSLAELNVANMIQTTDYKLYLNGFSNDNNDIWEECIVPLGNPDNYGQHNYCTDWVLFVCIYWKNDSKWRRGFHGLGAFINRDANEYNEHSSIPPGKVIPYGTFRLERDTGDGNGPVAMLSQNWFGQNWYNTGFEGGTLSQQIKAGGYLYYRRNHGEDINSLDTVRNAMHNSTQLRYYKRLKTGVNWEMKGDYIWINKFDMDDSNLVPKETKITVDGEFITILPPEYYNTPNKPLIERLRDFTRKGREEQISLVSKFQIDEIPLFVVDLTSKKRIRYIDIQGGYLYKPASTTNDNPYPCNFKVSIKYCNKDIDFDQLQDSDFSEIRDETEGITMSEGVVVNLEEKQLGERLEARYLKFYVSTGNSPDIEEGPDSAKIKWYAAAIAGLAIYESDLIVSEKYVNAEVINLYKDSTVYDQLYTQALVDSYAQAKLTEFQKNRTEVTVSIPFSPHYEMGQTVYLNDIENGVARNYFIEEVASSDGEITLTLAYYT